MLSRNHARILAAAFTVPLLLSIDTRVAYAQETAVEETLVVTARRREESSQDVPIAITAFSEAEIEAAGIERPQDFIGLTPNVTLVETQNQGTSFLTMRGISQARNSEPSAAILIDGVLLTNPAQLTQEFFDVQQIEVLKGPQGAIYGRNAIGGAIVVTTHEPGDEFEGELGLGFDDGSGYRIKGNAGGPLGDSDTLKYQVSAAYYDTDGWIQNTHLNEEADPFEDLSLRGRMIWQPSDRLTVDGRVYFSQVDTQALYYNIVGNIFTPPDLNDANDTSLDVRVNNRGTNERDLSQLALKIDYDSTWGTFTSITSHDTIEELLTGDQWDFLPLGEGWEPIFFGIDRAQHQYLDVDTLSQEFRLTSDGTRDLRWIGGVYFTQTDRYISTGNVVDRNMGAPSVYRTPLSAAPYDGVTAPDNDQVTFLADSQDNFAWAIFGEVAYDLNPRTEISLAIRYDEDERENTTLTPTAFIPPALTGAFTGEVRKKTWSEPQPRLTLRYRTSDTMTLYGSWGRGFRSGGFNQTGVGADATAIANGITDLFDDEVAETLEFGLKSQLAGGRVGLDFSVYDTDAEGGYYFVFLDASSTQNLGSLGAVDYQGYEIDVAARITDHFDLRFSYGYTDSEITEDSPNKPDSAPSYVGNQAPLVTEDTINLTAQYHMPFGGRGLEFIARADYQRIGDTWWFPDNATVRSPVNLLGLRIGVQSDDWTIMAWGENVHDREYNTEWSPGGFVFKARPARYGVDFTKRF